MSDLFDKAKYNHDQMYHIKMFIMDSSYRDYVLDICKLIRYRENSKTSIIDLGCGEGLFVFVLNRLGFKDVSGIDANKLAIKLGQNFGIKNLIYGRIERLKFSNTFEIALIFDVFEHIKDISFILKILRKSISKRIYLVNPTQEEKSKQHHVKHYTNKEIIGIFQKNNFWKYLDQIDFPFVHKSLLIFNRV